jgi:hypothetical protein
MGMPAATPAHGSPPGALVVVSSPTRSRAASSATAPLVDAICKVRDAMRVGLDKQDGETRVAGRAPLDEPAWKWTT